MATVAAGSQAGHDTFDALNIEYEKAYRDNTFKIAAIKKAITLLDPGSKVLDVGCGTGVPVSELLAEAGLEVVGFDIAPKMVEFAQKRVKGTFSVSDMVQFQVEDTFSGVFMIFAHLQLSYAAVHAAVYKYVGQMPSDSYVKDEGNAAYDETRTYVEDYDAPFMGEPLPTFMMSEQGQRNFLTSMGLEIVSETIDQFQPDNEKCEPEMQQYIIARRPVDGKIVEPQPLPQKK
ncbi:putative methyltransferase protein [Botrytis fragariae]|uniref:phosphoethanolamine N-methyltransferase n=1 Tax=Botrytis fragariae TaxID=1964551 RepID=A0A8H6AJE3_9HELO|nr:putative methyltransferase protein [Botrytis fragariae]KAF5868747.1 putative methyltransferase protein [Botrytis fragariae]